MVSRCPGIDSTGTIVYDVPRPVAYVFTAAVASADSGLALIPATATAAGDLLVRRALLVTKARALLGLGQIPEAAALGQRYGGAEYFLVRHHVLDRARATLSLGSAVELSAATRLATRSRVAATTCW